MTKIITETFVSISNKPSFVYISITSNLFLSLSVIYLLRENTKLSNFFKDKERNKDNDK